MSIATVDAGGHVASVAAPACLGDATFATEKDNVSMASLVWRLTLVTLLAGLHEKDVGIAPRGKMVICPSGQISRPACVMWFVFLPMIRIFIASELPEHQV